MTMYTPEWVPQVQNDTYNGHRETPRFDIPDDGNRALYLDSPHILAKFAKPATVEAATTNQQIGTDYIVEIPHDADDDRPPMMVVELSRVVARELDIRVHATEREPAKSNLGHAAIGEPHIEAA